MWSGGSTLVSSVLPANGTSQWGQPMGPASGASQWAIFGLRVPWAAANCWMPAVFDLDFGIPGSGWLLNANSAGRQRVSGCAQRKKDPVV